MSKINFIHLGIAILIDAIEAGLVALNALPVIGTLASFILGTPFILLKMVFLFLTTRGIIFTLVGGGVGAVPLLKGLPETTVLYLASTRGVKI